MIHWLKAARLRTLPLALSSTILASFVAVSEDDFNLWVLIFATLTTIFLQVLSNLANDYGDYKKGSDRSDRIGPERMVASGKISPQQMKIAVVIFVILSFLSGSALIYFGIKGKDLGLVAFFFVLGILAIVASIKYTVGKGAYGYYGYGDIMVFLFFGLTGVLGTYFLHTGSFRLDMLLPATSIGLLSAGVLNLNNLRDYESDKISEKRTLVVMMGNKKAKIYHLLLISGAVVTTSAYSLINFKSGYQFLFFLAVPLFFNDIKTVLQNTQPIELNTELKKLALSTLFFSLTFGIGCVIN